MLTVSRSQASKGAPLRAAKSTALAEINRRIGSVRLAFITDIPGQQAIYAAKEAEARNYLALSTEPGDLSGYPFLEKEVGITAPTAGALAVLWLEMADRWRSVGAELEQLRLGASASVNSAQNEQDVAAILTELETYLRAI
jgi:hypothetical protein